MLIGLLITFVSVFHPAASFSWFIAVAAVIYRWLARSHIRAGTGSVFRPPVMSSRL